MFRQRSILVSRYSRYYLSAPRLECCEQIIGPDPYGSPGIRLNHQNVARKCYSGIHYKSSLNHDFPKEGPTDRTMLVTFCQFLALFNYSTLHIRVPALEVEKNRPLNLSIASFMLYFLQGSVYFICLFWKHISCCCCCYLCNCSRLHRSFSCSFPNTFRGQRLC